MNFYHQDPQNTGKTENDAFKMLLFQTGKAELKFIFLSKCEDSVPALAPEAKQQYMKQCHFQAGLATHT